MKTFVFRTLLALAAGLSTALYVAADPVSEITKRTGGLLSKNNQSTTCEVVMFNEKFALTAASCLTFTSPGVIDASVKHSLVYSQGGDHAYAMVDIQRILVHPNYNPENFANNLAILFLPTDSPMPFSNPIADWPAEWQTFYYVQRAVEPPSKNPSWENPKVVSAQNTTANAEGCKSASTIFRLNPYAFMCSPLSLPTGDANCVMPYGVIYEYDGTQAVVAAIYSHSNLQGSNAFCSGTPMYSYYTIISNYISWIQTATGMTVNVYHGANAPGYVASSNPNYQMAQVEVVLASVVPVVTVTASKVVNEFVGDIAVKPAVEGVVINEGVAPVEKATVTTTSTQQIMQPTTVTITGILSATATTTSTTTATTTSTQTTVSQTTVTQTQVSVITVGGGSGGGGGGGANQSVGVNINLSAPVVTVTSTLMSTTTITITAPPTGVPANPVVVTAGILPAPITVTITQTAGPGAVLPATITTTNTVVSFVAGPGGMSIVPITQWMPTTFTATSIVTSTVTSLLPVSISDIPFETATSSSFTSTSLASDDGSGKPTINAAAIAAIALLSLLLLALLFFFIRRRKNQTRANENTDTSRVRRWFFFDQYQNQDRSSVHEPPHMSERAPPSQL
ncbi:hypothetical protein GGI20_002630 [Coemansia sp. BCRC 34301]|nr:hypothetical protein GGI20_002630 [Coemansia sp. BCRC 34301]